MDGAEPGSHRGPGYLPDRQLADIGSGSSLRPGHEHVQRVVRVRHLRGWNRSLLGAHPGAGVSAADLRELAAGRAADAGSGRHGCRMGVPVRSRGHHGHVRSESAQDAAGLVHPVLARRRGRGGRSRFRGWIRAGISGPRRSCPSGGLRHPDRTDHAEHPAKQPGYRRPRH